MRGSVACPMCGTNAWDMIVAVMRAGAERDLETITWFHHYAVRARKFLDRFVEGKVALGCHECGCKWDGHGGLAEIDIIEEDRDALIEIVSDWNVDGATQDPPVVFDYFEAAKHEAAQRMLVESP